MKDLCNKNCGTPRKLIEENTKKCKHTHCFLKGQKQYGQSGHITKLTNGMNLIPIKIQVTALKELENTILKFIQNQKRSTMQKASLAMRRNKEASRFQISKLQ